MLMRWNWFVLGFAIGLVAGIIVGLSFGIVVYSTVDKPVIYFYPETPTNVSVYLNTNELLTHSEPFAGFFSPVSWSFTALPNSTLVFSGVQYPYVYYETSYLFGGLPLQEGWSVPYDELGGFFDRELPLLGLSEREANEFKEYWLARLPESSYYDVYLVERSAVDSKLALSVSPKPDTVVRVIIGFKPTKAPNQLDAPVVSTPLRKGFTIVEWGGFIAG